MEALLYLNEISNADGFWERNNTWKVLELKIFQFVNKEQICNQ